MTLTKARQTPFISTNSPSNLRRIAITLMTGGAYDDFSRGIEFMIKAKRIERKLLDEKIVKST